MNANGLNARLEKLEAKREQRKKIVVFVESEEDLEEKRKQADPNQDYVYVHWDWGEDEIEI